MATLLNQKAFDLLREYNIPYLKYEEIKQSSDLKSKNYPGVLKINSPKIIHKTEKKAVRIVKNLEKAEDNFNEMRKIGQVVFQPFFGGRELIIGAKEDAAFGHVVMFGLGGIFAEVMKDVSFRVCPITKKDAREMISEIKGSKILDDFRGKKAADKNFLADVLVRVSKMAVKENIKELDINPFIIKEGKNGKAIDCRIIF